MTKEDLEEMEFGAADDLREVIALAKWAIEAKEALRRIEFMTSKGTATIFPASTIEACRDKARLALEAYPVKE